MKALFFRKSFLLLVLCFALLVTVALLGGCKGSDGSAGAAGANGHDGIYGPQCSNCHHMSDAQFTGIEPIRISGLATGGTATPGVAKNATVKSVFSNGTSTVNAKGYLWEFMDGLAATTSSSVTGSTLTVTVTPGQDYRAALVKRAFPDPALDRTMIVPVNGFSQELAQNAEYKVWVWGDDGKIYYDLAKLKASDNDVTTYAPVLTTGINNVPINVPVLLNARGTGPYTWSFTTNPGTAALDSTTIKNPYFTPDAVGQYVLSVVTTPTGTTVPVTDTLTIYAGDWRGAITGVDMTKLTAEGADYGTLVPDTACSGCHDGSTAPDKFTPWKSSGHATRFEGGLNEGGHYGPSCFPCHTVGFVSTAKNNGGLRDQANYSAFIADTTMFASTADSTRYSRMSSPTGSYYDLFRETGIQCENCHGPQNKNTTGRATGDMSAAHQTTTNGVGPRVSLSSDVCGECHGSPQHHGRFQEWQQNPTGHASYELAQGEGTSASCAGCHSAQGNLVWIDQLVNKHNPLRGIPSAKITWTVDTVQPQTCVVCHDPHQEGMTTGETTDAQPRITGDTPKLPAGFAALGVGKGAQCIVCHNSRNGGVGSTASDGTTTGDAYLHEDSDPVFGGVVSTTPTSYAAPHAPTQGDVLMGHNAYFVGSSGGNSSLYKSPHATIVDTCVNCHMVKTKPPVEFSDYENTNHTFMASMDICSECHGVDAGLGPKLQADTQALLDRTLTDIQGAIVSQANAIISQGTGTPISSVTLGTSHGSPAVDVVYADSSTAAGVSISTLVPLNSEAHRDLAKAIWNYNLINNDSSLGVHNPDFTRTVLGVTDAKARELQ